MNVKYADYRDQPASDVLQKKSCYQLAVNIAKFGSVNTKISLIITVSEKDTIKATILELYQKSKLWTLLVECRYIQNFRQLSGFQLRPENGGNVFVNLQLIWRDADILGSWLDNGFL